MKTTHISLLCLGAILLLPFAQADFFIFANWGVHNCGSDFMSGQVFEAGACYYPGAVDIAGGYYFMVDYIESMNGGITEYICTDPKCTNCTLYTNEMLNNCQYTDKKPIDYWFNIINTTDFPQVSDDDTYTQVKYSYTGKVCSGEEKIVSIWQYYGNYGDSKCDTSHPYPTQNFSGIPPFFQ